MMTLYLDMDGVLVDFFGGLEKHFNVDHWKKIPKTEESIMGLKGTDFFNTLEPYKTCLLYTSPSPRDQRGPHMPSSA